MHTPRDLVGLALSGLVATTLLALAPRPALAEPVSDWNARAGAAARAACLSPSDDPLHESRLYAMVGLAVHDTLNAISRRYDPGIFDGRADGLLVGSDVDGGPGRSREPEARV